MYANIARSNILMHKCTGTVPFSYYGCILLLDGSHCPPDAYQELLLSYCVFVMFMSPALPKPVLGILVEAFG